MLLYKNFNYIVKMSSIQQEIFKINAMDISGVRRKGKKNF